MDGNFRVQESQNGAVLRSASGRHDFPGAGDDHILSCRTRLWKLSELQSLAIRKDRPGLLVRLLVIVISDRLGGAAGRSALYQ